MSIGGVETQSVDIPGVVVSETQHDQAAPPMGSSVAVAERATVTSTATGTTADEVAATAAGQSEAPEKKKAAPRSTGMAAGGQPVGAPGAPPGVPVWPQVMNEDEIYVPQEFDVTDLAEVNRELNRARARIFRVSQTLKLAQRTLAEAQSDYDRAFRRQMVSITGGTAESRKAMAEINCEGLENRIVVGKQVVEEWRKRAMDTRDDLKAIENIAHNVRAQIDIR